MKRIAMAAAFAATAGAAHAGGQVTQGMAGPSPSIQAVLLPPTVSIPAGVLQAGNLAAALGAYYGGNDAE